MTLAEALSERGIRWKSLTPGKTDDSLVCPRCRGGDHRDKFSLTIDWDGLGAVWQCWRKVNCGWTDGLRVDGSSPLEKRVRQKPPTIPRQAKDDTYRPQWLYDYFVSRKISAATVNHFGIYAEKSHWFGYAEKPAIVLPYRFAGKLVNRKYRSEDKDLNQDSNPKHTLFNVDALSDEPAEIVWVEGEFDVMALHECGIRNAVSLKDGAPQGEEKSAKRYDAMVTHDAMLSKAKRIVLACDADGPGLALRDELARRLGKHRCFTVTWPEGCKDANDVLMKHGVDAVNEAIRTAEAYPIKGIYRLKSGTLHALRSSPPIKTMTTGVRSTDDILQLPTEGRLIVVTGIPSHGKTSWVRWIAMHTAKHCDRRWAIFTPEHMPQEEFLAELAEIHAGKPIRLGTPDHMTDEELDDAEEFIQDKITLFISDSEKEVTTLDWMLDLAKSAVQRYGVTDVLMDPWNELEHARGELSETDYIGRSLQRCKAFGLRYGCNVWIIAHPMKPLPLKHGEKALPPGLYGISGSSHWANKSDLGITVFAPEGKAWQAEIHITKSRFRRWATKGTIAKLGFDARTGRYFYPELGYSDAPITNYHDDD